MLEVKQLQTYRGDIQVLKSVDLKVHKGEIVALIGANGAGKSTFLGTLAGLFAPRKGEVRLDDQLISGLPAYQIVKSGLSLVPEGRQIFPSLTVKDNLLLGMFSKSKRKHEVQAKLEMILEMFPGLRKHLHNYGGNLSGGEQQMLAIGRGLMSDPKIILLDEPSIGLAPLIVSEVLQILKRIKTELGTMVLLVEQNVKAALKVADRAYVMDRGEIILDGKAEDVINNPTVQSVYLGNGIPVNVSRA